MSYDIELLDPITMKVIEFTENHGIRGGTHKVGGDNRAWLNITYNYGKYYYKLLGEKGIRTIYGMTGKDASPLLLDAINNLKEDVSDDYWEDTEGNARKALIGLLEFALLRPDGIFEGD